MSTERVDAKPSVEYTDFIVVGGGSSGCVVAGRLSEDPAIEVTLLEAGGRGEDMLVRMPAAIGLMVPGKIKNWAFETVPQNGLNGRKGYQPRGKVLGGSSSINGMIYIRGHRGDYDHWAALGNSGWSYEEVLPFFKVSENNEQHQDDFHGGGGPLNVTGLRSDNPFQQIFLQAGREVGFPYNPDFNGAEQDGIGLYQVTQIAGERCSAARAFLLPHLDRRGNLKVRTGCQVLRILFEGNTAVGVLYRKGSATHELRARREVILSAGALQSPQILLLSGIGDAEELQRHGVTVQQHLPGVGRNLQDHLDFALIYEADSLDLFGISLRGGLRLCRELLRYRRERRGLLASNFAECGGFLKSRPELAVPDIQIHFAPAKIENHGRQLYRQRGHGFSCHICLLRPRSQGSIRLAGPDPMAPPLIDPAFLDHEDDLEDLLRAFKLVRQLMDAPALRRWRKRDLVTAHVHSDDEIRAVIREGADTIYHPVGTCKMGIDDQAVVGPDLKVHGIRRLRVVDASIMPTLIGGNTNAPSIMIAEKAVSMIRKDCCK